MTPTQARLHARIQEVQLFQSLIEQADTFANELDQLGDQASFLKDGSTCEPSPALHSLQAQRH